jgi:hypothetical protein
MTTAPSPLIRDGFLWESLDEGCLLYHEESGKMVTLNHEAEIVLSHCTGEFPLPDLLRLLEEEFAMAPTAAQAALRQLEDEGVIDPLAWPTS